eukprot:g1598.t1
MSFAVAAVQRGLNGVLNDGLGDLLQYVDGKIGWFPPRAWVWLPGVYEWSVDAGEGDGHSTSYRLELSDDQVFTYRWQNLEKKRKKRITHEMQLRGAWRLEVPEEDGSAPAPPASSDASDEGKDNDVADEADEKQKDNPVTAPAACDTAIEGDGGADPVDEDDDEPASNDGPTDGADDEPNCGEIVLCPSRASFSRRTAAGSREVVIATKTDDGWMDVRPREAADSAHQQLDDAENCLPPFELRFRVKRAPDDEGTGDIVDEEECKADTVAAPTPGASRIGDGLGQCVLVLAGGSDALACFPSCPQTLAFVGATSKTAARLGDPGVIVGTRWVPSELVLAVGDRAVGLTQSVTAPFSAVAHVARYLKTHSPKYFEHQERQRQAQRKLRELAEAIIKEEKEAAEAAAEAAKRAREEGLRSAAQWLRDKQAADGDLTAIDGAGFSQLAQETWGVDIPVKEANRMIDELENEAEERRRKEMEGAGGDDW